MWELWEQKRAVGMVWTMDSAEQRGAGSESLLMAAPSGTHILQPDPLVEKEGSILSWMSNDGEISGLGIMKSSLWLALAASINQGLSGM